MTRAGDRYVAQEHRNSRHALVSPVMQWGRPHIRVTVARRTLNTVGFKCYEDTPSSRNRIANRCLVHSRQHLAGHSETEYDDPRPRQRWSHPATSHRDGARSLHSLPLRRHREGTTVDRLRTGNARPRAKPPTCRVELLLRPADQTLFRAPSVDPRTQNRHNRHVLVSPVI